MSSSYIKMIGLLIAGVFCSVAASAQTVEYQVTPIISPFDPADTVTGHDINASGVLPLTAIHNGQHQAFVWKRGKSIPLTLLGGTCGSAVGINYEGHIV